MDKVVKTATEEDDYEREQAVIEELERDDVAEVAKFLDPTTEAEKAKPKRKRKKKNE